MAHIKRKVILYICIGFLILYSFSLWGLTGWKKEDLTDSMYNDFMNASDLLLKSSHEDGFSENSQSYLNEFSSNLAQRNIYAAAVIINMQGDILAKSDTSDIVFNGRHANAVDSSRLADCIRDAQKSINNEFFPKGATSAGYCSSGSTGHTQGWTMSNNNENMTYLIVNSKFFERELAIKKMIFRYIQTFISMGIICFFLCSIISRIIVGNPIDIVDSNNL